MSFIFYNRDDLESMSGIFENNDEKESKLKSICEISKWNTLNV